MVAYEALPPAFDRLLVVLSDVEMGAGGPADDCPHSESVADLLLEYSDAHPHTPVDFVFNGDTFDFLKTSVDGAYPRHVTEEVALEKLRRIAAAHGPFFEKVGRVLERRDCTVSFVAGNHDLELFFPQVQSELRRLIGAKVSFPGVSFELADVRVEHGSQGDPTFRIDPDRVFLEHDGRIILNLPWGAVGVIDVVLPYHAELHLLDRIRPKQAVFELLPEARQLLTALARRYWLGAYWRDLLVERDPLKQVSWEILKEVAYRFVATDPDVTFGRHYVEALEKDEQHSVVVVGHEHVGRQVRLSGNTLIATGCLRNEYTLEPTTGALSPCERSVAEVRLRGGRAVDARLVPVALPSARPEDIRSLRPALARCLDELEPAPELLPALALAASRIVTVHPVDILDHFDHLRT